METKQLAAFCAVVERRSFSQAAASLGVTQPAVSQQVRALERRIGQQLLDRSGRRVVPTDAGQRLYRSAQRMLAAEEQLLSGPHRHGGRRADGDARDRRVDGPGRDRRAAPPRRVRARAPAATRRARRARHADGRLARRRAGARARHRRSSSPAPVGRVLAVLQRRCDPRLPTGAPVRRAAPSRWTSLARGR